MTSGVERDAYIRQLYAEGWSAIEIGAEMGLSRSQVHRILAAAPADELDADEDDDLTADELERVNAYEDGYPPRPPFRFVGVELVIRQDREMDHPQSAEQLRFLDANGRSCDDLGIWRARMALEEDERYAESEAISADLDRQYAEAGYRWVVDPDAQRWRLVRAEVVSESA